MPYNFKSPGAAAGSAFVSEIERMLTQREARERQAMLDQITVEREKRLSEAAKQDAEIRRESLESLKEQRKTQAVVNQANIDARNTETAGKMYRPGDVIGQGDTVTPSAMRTDQMTLPGRSQTLTPSMPALPGEEAGAPQPTIQGQQMSQEKTGQQTFRGTSEQRERQLMLMSPLLNDRQKKMVASGVNLTASSFDEDEAAGNTDYERYLFATYGPSPTPAQRLQARKEFNQVDDRPQSSEGRPYFMPVTTGEGVKTFDTRTGKYGPDPAQPLRPGATAESDLTRGGSTLYALSQIESQFNPAWVGPARGRYNTMQLALVGEQGEAGLANMAATLATLQNTVINLRTGAQMSEPEAQRILNEIPSMNQPPDVFMSRLSSAKRYFEDWYKRRQAFAYGRPNDVPAIPGIASPAIPSTGSGVTRKRYDINGKPIP